MNNNNGPPPEVPTVNPPMEAAPESAPTVNPPMGSAPPGVPASKKPPSVSSEDLDRMIEAGIKANRADWESDEVDFTGAGPQPLDDSAFGGDD